MHRALVLAAALALSGCNPMDPGAPEAEAEWSRLPDAGDVEQPVGPPPVLRVIDGDTFVINGEVIRIANIDAPEMPPRARCASEAQRARAATESLADILGVGREGRPHLEREGRDRYGRTLARVGFVSGFVDAGDIMVERGHARRWTGRRESWCDGDRQSQPRFNGTPVAPAE